MASSRFYPENMNWAHTQHSNPVSYKNEIILNNSHERFIPDNARQPHTVVIDSRDRNTTTYPNSNNYIIDFKDTYHDVYSVEISGILVPRNQYNITSNNNTLHIFYSGTLYSVTITPGYYDDHQLSDALNTAMRNATGNNSFTIQVLNTKTMKFTISANSNFELRFAGSTETLFNGNTRTLYNTNSIARVLGYKSQNYTGSNTYTADFCYDLSGEKYAILDIPELKRIESNNDSTDGSFAIIYFDVDHLTQPTTNGSHVITSASNNHSKTIYKIVKSSDFGCARAIKYFSPIAGSLNRLTIRWKNYDGQYFDFGGLDHIITLEITTVKQHTSYNK